MTSQPSSARPPSGPSRAEQRDGRPDSTGDRSGRAARERPARGRGEFAAELRARRLAAALERSSRRRDPDAGEAASAAPGGPLGHQRTADAVAADPTVAAVPAVDAVADRILAGVDGGGRASARVELGGMAGADWAGTSVELVAGARGVEVSVVAQSSAARRQVEARLSDLARALADRGVKVARVRVVGTRAAARGDKQPGARQDGR